MNLMFGILNLCDIHFNITVSAFNDSFKQIRRDHMAGESAFPAVWMLHQLPSAHYGLIH